MTTGNQDRLKGSIDTIKGKAKKVAGVIGDDQKLQNEGSLDEVKGKLEKAKANVKDAIHRTVDKT
jgi:uncharacterized protein YjbJ (UPF0337 family)